ncbi:MAG: hypothetical protein LBS30_03625 [Planctomycetota bacterium]|jgi:hypothetical protein|nr:hypothetical protein [Planctomycetota bacterium]
MLKHPFDAQVDFVKVDRHGNPVTTLKEMIDRGTFLSDPNSFRHKTSPGKDGVPFLYCPALKSFQNTDIIPIQHPLTILQKSAPE